MSMSPEEQENLQSPPFIAQQILYFFVPSVLREPILGDLEEEFYDLILQGKTESAAGIWYWQQAVRTACLYLWQERGNNMAYLIGFLFFILINVFAMILSGNHITLFINLPTIVVILPAALVLAIGSTSFSSLKLALKMSFTDRVECDVNEAKSAHRFLKVAGKQCLLVGWVAFFIGTVAILGNMPVEEYKEKLRFALAVDFLAPMYAYMLKCLFYSAQEKVFERYLED